MGTFVLCPELFESVEISVIEGMGQLFGTLVVQHPCPPELISFPLPLVCQFPALVVQPANPVHFPLHPISIIHASILVIKPARPIFHSVYLIAFVPAALGVDLSNVLGLRVEGGVGLAGRGEGVLGLLEGVVLVDLGASGVAAEGEDVAERTAGCYVAGAENRQKGLAGGLLL